MPKQPLISVFSTFLLIALVTGCSDKHGTTVENSDSRSTALKPVRTITISLGQTKSRSFPGVIDAHQSAEIGFRVAGELKQVNVTEGQAVKQGEIIAQLDQTDYKISLKGTESDFLNAKSDFDRARKLIKKGAISQADFDKLSAQLSTAKTRLESAEQNLKYTVLKSPFDGVVARTYLSNFEKVTGTEKFAAIQDLSSLEVAVDVPESIMIKVKRGPETREVFAVFEDSSEKRYPLSFKEVSTRADEKTQTYRVRFVMDAPTDINVLPGMSTTVYAVEKLTEDRQLDLHVPAHAVLEDSAGRFVYVVKQTGSTNQGSVERRGVVIGKLSENGIQIVKGLIIGDEVITAGMSKINPGMAVRLMSEG